jgi:hypothetical protein
VILGVETAVRGVEIARDALINALKYNDIHFFVNQILRGLQRRIADAVGAIWQVLRLGWGLLGVGCRAVHSTKGQRRGGIGTVCAGKSGGAVFSAACCLGGCF